MAIVINEFEVTETRPEVSDRDEQSRSAVPATTELVDIAQKLAQLEERAIRAALEKFGKSTEGKKNAACALGLSLATFYRKIRSFSI